MDKWAHVYKGFPPDCCVCDQALRKLPDGRWAIFFMTGGEHEPRRENYIAMCLSDDEGVTWTKPKEVLRYRDKACMLSEVIVYRGEIRLFAHTHLGAFEDWKVYVLMSRDNAWSWEEPTVFEPMARRAFLRNLYISTWGEWFLPFQRYDPTGDCAASPIRDGSFKRVQNGVLISNDQGRTWERSSDTGPLSGWAENNVVELSDGRLVMFIRADCKGVLYRSESTNRGRTWSYPEPSDIPNPGSKFRLHRLSSGRILLLHNPSSTCGIRNPLALWASDDDVKTWSYKRILADFPGKLQYPDGFVDDGETRLHFAFDYNRHDLIYCGAALPD